MVVIASHVGGGLGELGRLDCDDFVTILDLLAKK
jgi:hypothetical protein